MFVGYWWNHRLYSTQDELVWVCSDLSGQPGEFQMDVGSAWNLPFYQYTFYNHISGPNSGVPDCVGGWNDAKTNGLFSARSYHPGGVKVLHVDGHAAFVRSGISIETWRALGTRNGREVISADSY